MVAEGINSISDTLKLSEIYKIGLPIVTAISATINEAADSEITVKYLMSRDKKLGCHNIY